jgi:hypothetical protein
VDLVCRLNQALSPVALPWPARVALGVGIGALLLVVVNQWQAPEINPSLERASVLAGALAVGLMLVAALWTRAVPEAGVRVDLQGREGVEVVGDLPDALAEELGWGSQMLLTATPAATLVVVWDGQALLRRGLLGEERFMPGDLCARARSKGSAISLVDLRLYPGRAEFDGLLPGLPAVVVQPLADRGWVVMGGWSVRCFSRSDLQWLEGWGRRLTVRLESELPAAGSAGV